VLSYPHAFSGDPKNKVATIGLKNVSDDRQMMGDDGFLATRHQFNSQEISELQ